MPRAVPSDWCPKGIELLEVKPLYDSRARLEILSHLGSLSASRKLRLSLLYRSLNTAAMLRVHLHYARKPNRAQIISALAPSQAAARAAAEAFLSLDFHSRELIEQAADRDEIANSRSGQEIPRRHLPVYVGGETELFEMSLGRERFSAALRAIDDLDRWASAAPALDYARPSPRTVRKDLIRSAIGHLEVIWRDAWKGREKEDPKLSPFLPLVQVVLNPVLAEDGSPEDLRRATEDVLHGSDVTNSIDKERSLFPSGGSD